MRASTKTKMAVEFCLITLVAMQSGSQICCYGRMFNIPASTGQNKDKHNNIMLNLIGNNLKYDTNTRLTNYKR